MLIPSRAPLFQGKLLQRNIQRYYSKRDSQGFLGFRTVRTLSCVTALCATAVTAGFYIGHQYARLKLPPDAFPLKSVTPLESLSSPSYCTQSQLERAVEKLRGVMGSQNVSSTKDDIEYHSQNEFTSHAPLEHERPKYVIYPLSTEEVSQAVKIINEYNVPIVPFGGGTSLEGNFHSTRPGIVLDTSKMNKILEVHHDDLDAVVQAGVNWQDLNNELESSSLMFGPDCGPNGQVSGMINTNASGINALRYGAMVANVISVTVVLADGTVVKTKKRPRKSSAGYNLTGLFVGSEGTLGIVTEATVKLQVKPRYETVVVGQFSTIKNAIDTVAQVFRTGIQPHAIEFLDKDFMHCINYSGFFTKNWFEWPTIFFKIGGINKTVVEEHIKELKAIACTNNCQAFLFARNEEEREELFSARKNGFYAMLTYGHREIDENIRVWVTDIAVPISRLPTVLQKINDLVKTSGFQSVVLGHLGDGNFHADLFYKNEEMVQAEKVINKITDLGLANEGTCTGEHGVGNTKRSFLMKELGPDTIALMRKIKYALDPKRLLNPDKIFKIDPNDDRRY